MKQLDIDYNVNKGEMISNPQMTFNNFMVSLKPCTVLTYFDTVILAQQEKLNHAIFTKLLFSRVYVTPSLKSN